MHDVQELKRCPFCGAVPECGVSIRSHSSEDIRLDANVRCPRCGTSKTIGFKAAGDSKMTPFGYYLKAFSDVVNQWNNRMPDII